MKPFVDLKTCSLATNLMPTDYYTRRLYCACIPPLNNGGISHQNIMICLSSELTDLVGLQSLFHLIFFL